MNEEYDYEVSWTVAVSGSSPEDVARFVNDTYLEPCDGGDWVYMVTNIETGEQKMVTVNSDG